MNILLAEDEKDIRDLLQLHLIKVGYTPFLAKDGEEAIKLFKEEEIHLALLDVMMPKIDGFKVLQYIRESSNIPILLITARVEDEDKILGLGLGADDYIPKPFSPLEVVARIKAQLRRYNLYGANESSSKIIKIGDLKLDEEKYCIYKNGEELSLNAKEFKLLAYFMENPGRVFTKKQIYEAIWEDYYAEDANTIMVHISHLRDKVEDNPKDPKYIKTIRGIGYRMEKI
ncbi:response regulator transcription factor [Tissierella sp. MSJ-40]|uniref:Response regulator transcription factor n=1 Tax=Tissierella simiarum TaxID=2841534 RepID=A0ABS6EAF6_9FIRM|nr:response regulator transcription factor [Tissierella simiarum]MBU5439906.1 response regulator transcription factor [Tissierella simiarum]